MNIYTWPLVILVASLAVFWGMARLYARGEREYERITRLARLDQLAADVTLLPRAGYLPGPPFAGAADPGQYEFPDTGPLIIWSETRAAGDALEREVKVRIAEAEAKIPPRWRS